jgi:hypothetical protein
MSHPTTLKPPWTALIDHAGGVSRLAADLRVTRNTLHAWGKGKRVPSPAMRESVNAWARRRQLPEPFSGA